MRRLRVGFVGAGSVALRHAATLGAFDDVRIVGLTDPDPLRARALAELCDAKPYRAQELMLDEQALDALYICVPPFAHGPPEFAAIAAGIPFLVEKPVALNLATAAAVAERLGQHPVITAVGYHWRYLDTVERVRAILAQNPARLAMVQWLDKVPPVDWWARRDRSGGQVVEQVTHILDLARVLLGEVVEVYAVGSGTQPPQFPDCDIHEVTVGTLRFSTGAVASLTCTCLLRGKFRTGIQLACEGMMLELSEDDLVIDDGERRTVQAPTTDAKARLDRDFIDAVRGRSNDIRAPYAEALVTHRVACALARSAEERRPIMLASENPDG